MVAVVYEDGFAKASVTLVCSRAQVPRQAFYEVFRNREDCFLTVLEDGYRQVSELIQLAFARHDHWREGVRAAFMSLLAFFDEHPALARVWVVESLAAGSRALARREQHLAALTKAIVKYWRPPGAELHPWVAETVMRSAVWLVQAHLMEHRSDSPLVLLGPLMGLATAPYADAGTVNREIERGRALTREMVAKRNTDEQRDTRPFVVMPATLRDPRARRARDCVRYLAEHSGASNRQVAGAIGISSRTQMSALLGRLAAMGLLVKQASGPGRPNAWGLTARGRLVAGRLKSGSAATALGEHRDRSHTTVTGCRTV
jgi:AcrR family transcriptional regulator